jgi:hypothetical protein
LVQDFQQFLQLKQILKPKNLQGHFLQNSVDRLKRLSELVFFLFSTGVLDFALGKFTLIALGLTMVDKIRKNNSKKNMMSFNASVLTSASLCAFLRNPILFKIYDLVKLDLF